jgi:hypothetical protein
VRHGKNLGERDRIEPRSALSRPHWLKPVPAFLFLSNAGAKKAPRPDGGALVVIIRNVGQIR